MKALVVDDSRAMRALLKRMLVGAGFEVDEAAHGKEALERLGAGELPALALVDWNMPEMNGFDFVKAVRARPDYRDMRMMMVTTETEAGYIADALAAGADEYMMKPFTADSLKDKLALLGFA